ncbi:hypothetical protein PHISCL_07754 [Aspergillus sclerotialis]|uniref:Uncharacterized protein n=1 Tax=Aspergillus sclerotialis TaxID=2070753 RepID=A0A3A2ZAG8_9EURO|nr:hypothetical protein PHISCL_07754 [Aspergillus sclerotialis]
MKLGLSISALFLAAGTVAAYDEYSCIDSKCQAECTPTDGGRNGDVVGPKVGGSPWCYLQAATEDTTMQCSGKLGCKLQYDSKVACVTKDGEPELGGCGV